MLFYHDNHSLTSRCENYTSFPSYSYVFKLSEKGFNNEDDPYFVKYNSNLLHGFWSSAKADCVGTYKTSEGDIQFCKKGYAPIVTSRGSSYAKYACTTPGTYKLKYDILTGKLSVGSTTLSIPSGIFILDMLSAGGYGGPGIDILGGKLYSGGGGGSGSFISLLVNAGYNFACDISVGSSNYYLNYSSSVSRRSSDGATSLTFSPSNGYGQINSITLTAGENGMRYDLADDYSLPSGGGGGSCLILGHDRLSSSTTAGTQIFSDFVVLDYKDGVSGGTATTCGDKESALGGMGSGYYIERRDNHYISFGGLWSYAGPQSRGGSVESSPSGAGGGAGAGSVYGTGRSYGDTTVNVGAGGVGSAAWESDWGANYTDYTAGGPGGFFIYY